jgi:hypothetical protein
MFLLVRQQTKAVEHKVVGQATNNGEVFFVGLATNKGCGL